ncbi:type II toxin-antitoxin system VapC family toxin [Microvirga pudoricolor]|uniref:type II toxin-antitoxin system VapC family toxin n=1 Tax=Microvirga pudoricolor TaxID=2778729 RepID=UPI00194E9AD9|nr:type II toxin-antitoxin system VapC family toxin [Microvirga pudoricolor]MBM6593838.1 type II toxin-antitoxin system VapC family toxin [Microvirga pudoricolor]
MRYLLDTHLLVWIAGDPDRLSTEAVRLIEAEDNQLFFSAASLWEIAIKNSLARADFLIDARVLRQGLLDRDYREIPVTSDHAVAIDGLPAIHKDPFDRILIAQAMVEGVVLLTADATIARYPGPVRQV